MVLPAGSGELHPVMKMELFRLQETWNILRQHADAIWPGWSGFDEVPFLFNYENGVRMLVGHPDPPPEFEIVEGIEVEGKPVYIDRSREIAVELVWPMDVDGGVSRLGSFEGRDVRVVSINPRSSHPRKEGTDSTRDPAYSSENTILLYIHELFHVFQPTFFEFESGNLQYNPDVNYAVYSEMEGRALLEAFKEDDEASAKEYLEDFVIARKLKFGSMAETEQLQELGEDINEGTARYVEYAALQNIETGYIPVITERDDPYFHGFDNLEYYYARRMEYLMFMKNQTLESKMKCYSYGCFQALLLSRFVDGWKQAVGRGNASMYSMIVEFLGMDEDEAGTVALRLNERYGYDSLVADHGPVIDARDTAFEEYNEQEGIVYVVNFEPTMEFPIPQLDENSEWYRMGFRSVYPKGFKQIEIKEVTLEGKGKSLLVDQIYYLRYVDTERLGHEIDFSKREEDIYYDATVNTSGFTLKAPRLRIRERGSRVKCIVLSKVSDHQ